MTTENLKEIIQQIDLLKQEADTFRPLNKEQEGRLMQKIRLDWNYHSNNMEGNQLTYGETKALLFYGITASSKPLKDHLEIEGHNEAVEWIMDVVKGKERPLNETFIKELHKLILKKPYFAPAKTPDGELVKRAIKIGQYKETPNHVETATGEMFYFASPEETPAKMTDLIDWYRAETEKKELHPLIIAVGFHYKFIRIHPFDDGNGRIARLLMNFILMMHDYPPAIVLTQDKKSYLDALHQSDQQDDYTPFVVFVGKSLIAGLELFLRAAKGESIEDEEDIDKKIRLLEAKLKKNEEIQQTKSIDTVRDIIQKYISPIFQDKIQLNKLSKLYHFFHNTSTYITINSETQLLTSTIPQLTGEITSRMRQDLKSIDNLNFRVNFNGFIKGGIQAFDLVAGWNVYFENYKYVIIPFTTNKKLSVIEKLYHQYLTDEEIEKIGNEMVNQLLEEIEQHITNHHTGSNNLA
ncbi:MAG: Fic family protein [Microscillaceae bacterium]|nr:Fic family protein [Microscillaceae bacterium]